MPDEPLSTAGASTLLGTNNLQTSIDSLKSTVDRLNQGLSSLVPQLSQMNRLGRSGGFGNSGAGAYPTSGFWGRNGGHGGQQQPRGTNGGGATFNGQPAGGGQQQGGQQGGAGAGQGGPPPTFGQRFMQTAGGKAGIAVAAGAGLNAGINRMFQQAGPDINTADLVAAQLSIGGANSRKAVLESMKGNVTGLNMADVAQGRYTLTRGLGIGVNSATDQRAQAAMGITGLINPGMGNAQVAQAMQSLNAPDVTIKQRGLGIGMGMGPGQHMDPLTLANQILQKIGNWQSINTSEKIQFHVDDPNGAVATTIRNWVAHGFLPADSADVVKEDIRAILVARMNKVGFKQLQRLGQQAESSNRKERKAALSQLREAGVNPESIVAETKEKESSKRDRSLDETDAFATGARKATDALTAFSDAINWFLKESGLGQAVGFYGGGKSVLGGGGGGSDSDIGAMSNQGLAYGFGGQPDEKMGSSSRGTPLSTSSLGSGSNKPSGAAGTKSGSGKATGSGRHSIKFIKPIAGQITSPFGTRTDPLNGRRKTHTGIDFGASIGTPIHASAAGRVTFSGSGGGHNWAGNYVMIDHGGGYATLYAHQSRTKARVGASVQQGEVIGFSGKTGRATGPHLHFEIHINGRPVNPAPYLSGTSVSVSGDPTTPAPAAASSAATTSPSTTDSGSGTSTADTSTGSGSSSSPGGGIITSELSALMSFAGSAGSSGSSSGNTGSAASDTSANTNPSSSTNATTTDTSSTPTAPSSVSGNKAIVKEMAAAKGWTGKQWDALYQLVMHESSFVIQKNPNSTAYGLFQFLNSTWATVGGKKTDDPRKQTEYGLKYIEQRYGDPIKAWAAWNAHRDKHGHHWYDTGAWEIPRDENAVVHKGEMIIPAREARQIREVLLNGSAYGATKPGRQAGTGGGLQITIEKGAISITTSGGVTSAGVNDLGKAVADALAQHDKIKKLQEGVLT